MGKVDDEVKALKERVEDLSGKIDQINYMLVQVINEVKNMVQSGATASGGGGGGSMSIDFGPIMERMEAMEKDMVRKQDLAEIKSLVATIASEEKKQSQETVARKGAIYFFRVEGLST